LRPIPNPPSYDPRYHFELAIDPGLGRAQFDVSGFGSIIGRNSFQRAKPDAVELLHEVMDIDRDAG